MVASKQSSFFVLMVCLLLGCATAGRNVWVKAGAGESEFAREKSVCAAQAQSESSGIDQGVFGKCMEQNGWSVQNEKEIKPQIIPAPNPMQPAFDALAREKEQRCVSDEFRLFFSKTACDPKDITAMQINDALMITEAEKSTVIKLRDQMERSQGRAVAAYREHGGESGERAAQMLESWRVFNDRNILDLIEGKQTWGEYNRYRKGLYLQLAESLQKLSNPQ